MQQLGVRLRLYGCERMRREKMLGEVIVPFASINLALGNTFWLTLEPRANLAVSNHVCIDVVFVYLYVDECGWVTFWHQVILNYLYLFIYLYLNFDL